jgi:dipeptidyl aminopeptidase/acylaminoacyl peptidase
VPQPIVRQLLYALLLLGSSLARSEELAEPTVSNAHPNPKVSPEAILRTEGPLAAMRLNSDKTLMAFVDDRGQSLRIMDLNTQDIYEVTPHRVGTAFFWTPDGKRLFYRELVRDGQAAMSAVKAYDTVRQSSVDLDQFAGSSGSLTLDPRDFTYYMMHEKGIASRRLDFPGERFARWQQRAKKSIALGRYIATQKSILWLSDLGLTLNALKDDSTGIESFDISPDGTTIAWATLGHQIYISHLGETPNLLGYGRDPRWHESRPLLLYAAGRVMGTQVYDYDIRISDRKGRGRFVTHSPDVKERWPQWWSESEILFTREGSTDLWKLRFRDTPEMTAQSPSKKPVAQ